MLAVAPIFFSLNRSTVSCLQTSSVLVHGDYFVNTSTLKFRLTIEDGKVNLGQVKFVSRNQLLIIVPPHDVPMHSLGLAATLEIAHFQDSGTQKPYWQVVSTTADDVSQAIRLQYYGDSALQFWLLPVQLQILDNLSQPSRTTTSILECGAQTHLMAAGFTSQNSSMSNTSEVQSCVDTQEMALRPF